MTASTDVLIVGSGLMGAIVARRLRDADPAVRIRMIDAGVPIGVQPGRHLHDHDDPAVRERYGSRVAVGIQGMYTGAQVAPPSGSSIGDLSPGMHHAVDFGEDAAAMPAVALSWNTGGMGVHWTAATPWPSGDEIFDFGDPAGWWRDLAAAQSVLEVGTSPLGPTEPGRLVLETLRRRYPASTLRHAQAMPMAVQSSASGPLPRTSPATIFPPIARGGDDRFVLRTGALASRLEVDSGRVTGVEWVERAGLVVVCADAVRTPQLLFASGIRPPALGRYLNEHAFITARVLLDVERFGIGLDDLPRVRDGEFASDSLWLPHDGSRQPFHGQIMNTTYRDAEGRALAYSVGISLYSPVESRAENRLVFSETETDVAGLPRIRFEFSYSPRDREFIDRALVEVGDIAREFGPFDPATERALLPPGSSLHLTGTVRAGVVDDGTSVCDPDGRVWGMENLYVAGNGVIPTPMVANVTLTGAITAIRAARALAAQVQPSLFPRG